ncbi:MAG: MFS transporter [Veillonellales bacterium]
MLEENVLAEKPTRRRFFMIFVLFIGIAVAFVDRVNVSILAANDPFLVEMGIKGQTVQIGLMMSSFLAVYGLANITLAPLGDLIGPRKMMCICVILMLISIFVSSLATTFMMLIIGRMLLGIGEGMYYPQQSVYVRHWIPFQERGRANASWIIGQSVAPAIAMPLLAAIIAHYGWRANFYLCFVLTLIPLWLFWFHTTDRPQESKKVNKAELAHIEAGMEEKQASVNVKEKLSLIHRLKLISKNPHYWFLVVWYMCLQFNYWGLVSWIPAYLKVAKGFSWAEMGWIASLPFIVNIFTKAINGLINDKIGRCAPLLLVSMILGTSFMYTTTVIPGKYPSAICLAFAVGFNSMATSSAWTLLQGLVPSRVLSTAGGTMNGISTGFSALSPVIIGFFISLFGSYDSGLYCLVAAGMLGVCMASFLTIKKY